MSQNYLENSIKKVVIIGPESTGKSTVSEDLARHYNTVFVPEFAREYLNRLDREYQYEDLQKIAKGQLLAEEEAERKMEKGFLFCDTDLQVIKVWSEHKYGRCSDGILQEIARRKYDFYFLTDIDLPWEFDPQREHPEPQMRKYFFEIYSDIVIHSGLPWKLLSGGRGQRLKAAVDVLSDTF